VTHLYSGEDCWLLEPIGVYRPVWLRIRQSEVPAGPPTWSAYPSSSSQQAFPTHTCSAQPFWQPFSRHWRVTYSTGQIPFGHLPCNQQHQRTQLKHQRRSYIGWKHEYCYQLCSCVTIINGSRGLDSTSLHGLTAELDWHGLSMDGHLVVSVQLSNKPVNSSWLYPWRLTAAQTRSSMASPLQQSHLTDKTWTLPWNRSNREFWHHIPDRLSHNTLQSTPQQAGSQSTVSNETRIAPSRTGNEIFQELISLGMFHWLLEWIYIQLYTASVLPLHLSGTIYCDTSKTMTLVVNNLLAIWRHFCLHGSIRQRRLWERLFKRRFIHGLTYLLTYMQVLS